MPIQIDTDMPDSVMPTSAWDCASAADVPVEYTLRTVNFLDSAIRSALRRVVHDYVAGWGIVLTQSPQERRRKKRVWDRRASERQAFRRPVWIHKANWVGGSQGGARSISVQRLEEMYLVHDLSESGIGLTSDTAPKSRLVVLEFDSWQGRREEIVVQLRWRKQCGWQDYRCGGRILGVLTPE